MAANPFVNFPFQAAGEPTNRTLPVRIAEIFNVKDFGATGNGVTDDWAAIMAAYNHGQLFLTVTSITGSGSTLTLNFASVPTSLVAFLFSATDFTNPAALPQGQVIGVVTGTPGSATVNGVVGTINVGDVIQFDLINKGTVYFPAGTYSVSAPLDFSNPGHFVHWKGELGASTVVGNFADYVFKRATTDTAGEGGGHVVESIAVINNNANGGGIRLGESVGGAIRNCIVTANRGINTASDDTVAGVASFEIAIENCVLNPGSNVFGSIGLMVVSDGPILNCRVMGFAQGMIFWGGESAQVVMGCHFESCTVGFQPGVTPTGANNAAGQFTLSACRFLNCSTAILNGGGRGKYAGILIEGTNGSAPGGANPQYGIQIGGDAIGSGFMAGVVVNGQFDQFGIAIAGGDAFSPFNLLAAIRVTNTGSGSAWSLPDTANIASFVECNVAVVYTMAQLPVLIMTLTGATWASGTASITCNVPVPPGSLVTGGTWNIVVTGVTPSGYNGTFAGATAGPAFNQLNYSEASSLPSGNGGSVQAVALNGTTPNVMEGDCFNVIDSTVSTWGGTPSGGGSIHAKVRWNGSVLTVVGT